MRLQQGKTKISKVRKLGQKEDKVRKNKKLGVQKVLHEALSPCQELTPNLALAF